LRYFSHSYQEAAAQALNCMLSSPMTAGRLRAGYQILLKWNDLV